MQFLFVLDPFVKVELLPHRRCHDINDSKLFPNTDLKVLNILILWQNKACLALEQKVHLSDVLVLVVDYDVLLEDLLAQESAHPLEERGGLVVEELDVLVPLFINKKRDIHLQIMRQLIQELV